MASPKRALTADRVPLSAELIEHRIYLIRNQNVMLDGDLAELYGVTAGRLNEQVKRNKSRFPKGFMFRITAPEERSLSSLRSQTAILKRGQHRKYRPYMFTEQGVAMLSSVLNSDRAVQVNIAIMRAFVKLREIMFTHKELSQKIVALENKYQHHDKEIQGIFDAIKRLLDPCKPRLLIGFKPPSNL